MRIPEIKKVICVNLTYFTEHIMSSISIISSEATASRTELDSHADSPVVEKGALILHHTGETVNVIPFTDGLGTCSDVPIVTAAVAYDSLTTGEITILLIQNALYIANMTQNLIPPIMLQIRVPESFS